MEPAVLYGSAVAASLVVLLVVTLLFFTRKTVSFEEAVLQPRQQQVAAKPKKAEARKEKKSDKKKTGKKEDEVDKQAAPVTVTVTPDPHVEFRVANEVVPLDEEHEQQLAKRQVHVDERPKKPILTKRNEPEQAADTRLTQIGRCNSFETVHPKDEYELIKSQQTRDQKPGGSDDDMRSDKAKVRDGKKKSAKSAKASRKYLPDSPIR